MSYKLGENSKLIAAIAPATLAAGSKNGTIIDRYGFYDGIVHLAVGTATGSPTAQGVSLKMQSGNEADGNDMIDVAGDVLAALTANNTESELNLDLNPYGRYLRVVPAVTFTGGTSPTIPVAVTIVLGNSINIPV